MSELVAIIIYLALQTFYKIKVIYFCNACYIWKWVLSMFDVCVYWCELKKKYCFCDMKKNEYLLKYIFRRKPC